MTTPEIELVGVWLTITELAARKGVTKQSMHKRVAKLVAAGLIEVRNAGRNRLVELAAFDHAVGHDGDAFREQSAQTVRDRKSTGADRDRMRDAQLIGAQYENARRAIELAKLRGEVVPINGPHGVEAGVVKAAEAIVGIVERIPVRHQEALANAAAEPAKHRQAIKDMCRDMRRAIAAVLQGIAAGASAEVEALGGVEIEISEPDNGAD